MIYLSEKVLKPEKFFIERCFVERNKAYYFIAEEQEKDKTYLCIKLWNKHCNDRFELEVVKVSVKTEEDYEDIKAEEVVTNEKEREIAIYEFFFYLPYIADNPQDMIIFEDIFQFIEKYFEDAYFYAEENMLYGEFLEIFKVKGKVIEGYYEGNLILTDIQLINEATGQTIKSYEDVNICSNFYIEEEDKDKVDYMIECFLESMSEYDISTIFKKAFKKAINNNSNV